MSESPTGVRIRRADGSVLECELVDDGVDENGIHNWMIANAVYQVGDEVTCEMLPGQSSIGFMANLPPGTLIARAKKRRWFGR